MTKSTKFDVIIIGAGPAGIISALQLAKKDYNIVLIEKKSFTKDKICGDALSLDVVNQLNLIDENLAFRFKNFANKIETKGVKIIAPSYESFDIPFSYKGKQKDAYVAKRIDFDNFLFSELKQFINITILENTKVFDLNIDDDRVEVSYINSDKETIILSSDILVGADGSQSFVYLQFSSD